MLATTLIELMSSRKKHDVLTRRRPSWW